MGSGLSSLTVAWDLSLKAYQVFMVAPEDPIAGILLERYSGLLTQEVIEAELNKLKKWGVHIQPSAAVLGNAALVRLQTTYDAVYLGLDALDSDLWPGLKDADGITHITPKLQTTVLTNVFAGGGSDQSLGSPVWQAAEGRFAATSIDRFLQNVSMTAGREKEGPFTTRLFTVMPDIPPSRETGRPIPPKGYTEEEALTEAKRCLQCECLACVQHCVYLERFKAYPKKYAREIYNNEAMVMGARQANKLINSCALCGLCEILCPNDFSMGTLCLEARRRMVRRGKMPPSAHEFALMDMAFSQSDRFSLVRHAPNHPTSRYLFFPGCQLCASAPNQVFDLYNHLQKTLTDGVGLMLGCCGAPAWWAGREELFVETLSGITQHWQTLGMPCIITACASCHKVFREHVKKLPIVSLWEVLLDMDMPIAESIFQGTVVAVHDPCTARFEPAIQEAVRTLLARRQISVEELPLGKDKTVCCGFGGLQEFANPELALETVQRRANESGRDYLAYCAMCRDQLARAGKRTVHLLDLFFPPTKDQDPALRKRPGWSDRRDNRTHLKERCLKEIWKEKPPPMEEHYRDIRLVIAPDVEALLEKRRILREDLQKVICHATQAGSATFYHEETGHLLASYRPDNATFWVEYSVTPSGYVVHNAYAHRMEVHTP